MSSLNDDSMNEPGKRLLHTLAFPALIVVLVLLAYGSVLSAGYVWDDDDYVLNNLALRSLDGLRRIWFELGAVPQYYPMVHTGFWLEFQLWGLHPTGYHVVNLLLHAGAAITLASVVDACVPAKARGWLTTGRLAAIWFALHPVCVESAAWITERKNVLSLFLALLAMRYYLAWRDGGSRRQYLTALVFFVAATLSKTVVCTLPAVLLVLAWHRRGRLEKRDWLTVVPMFVVGLFFAGVTVWMEKHHVGAVGAEWDFSLADRFVLAGNACWFYLCKILWPHPLSFVYSRWIPDGASLVQLLAPVSWLMLGVAFVGFRKKIGRSPAAIWLIFSGVLFPALGFVDVYPFRYSFVADHFQYHASTVLIAGLAAATHRFFQQGAQLRIVAVVVAVPLALLAWNHGRAFQNEESLWRATLEVNPDAWIAHNNLGLILLGRGEATVAEAGFRRAIELNRDHGNAWTNLGMALDLQGDTESARGAFEQAKRLLPDRPDMWRIVAMFHRRHDEHGAALSAWRECLLRNPNDSEALSGAVEALVALGRSEQADLLRREYLMRSTGRR